MHKPLRRRPKGYELARFALSPQVLVEGERPGNHGWVGLAMMAISAVTSAAAAKQKGDAEAASAQYQAAVARNNEIVAKQNATYALQKGAAAEENKRMQMGQLIGQEKAKMGASGLQVESESGLRLYSDTAQLGTLDALTIRNNAAREAYGWESQGVNYASEAKLDEMRMRNAEEAGTMGAFSSIIGGASSVAGKWSSMQSAGAFSS